MKLQKYLRQLVLSSAVLVSASLLQAQSVKIRDVRLTGSGCENSNSSASTTADGKTLSVLFDNYSVEIGQGSLNPQMTSLKKTCHVLIDVEVPLGYQFGLEQTDYRGYAALPASAYGMHRFTHVVPNMPIVSMREAQIKGPLADDYYVSVKQKPGRYVYSPCNQKFQTIEIVSELMVAFLPNAKDHSIASINLDSVDTGVHSSFVMNWRTCTK